MALPLITAFVLVLFNACQKGIAIWIANGATLLGLLLVLVSMNQQGSYQVGCWPIPLGISLVTLISLLKVQCYVFLGDLPERLSQRRENRGTMLWAMASRTVRPRMAFNYRKSGIWPAWIVAPWLSITTMPCSAAKNAVLS